MLSFVIAISFVLFKRVDAQQGADYGLDCSFPIQSTDLKCGNLLGDRKAVYEKYMEGCYKEYGKQACASYEGDRLEMSIRQPQSMVVSEEIIGSYS